MTGLQILRQRPPGWSRFAHAAYLITLCAGLYVAGFWYLYPFTNEFGVNWSSLLTIPLALAATAVLVGLLHRRLWALRLTWVGDPVGRLVRSGLAQVAAAV